MSPPAGGGAPGPVAIDACCLIDLLASGRIEDILRANGSTWYLPSAVQAEVRYNRQCDPKQPGVILNKNPANLAPLIAAGLLIPCQPNSSEESARYVHYATIFRSDGEAMCLALAESRGWTVATDDKQAIKVAGRAGLPVISGPKLVRTWADATQPPPPVLVQVLIDIQTLARFRPNAEMPDADWWERTLATA